MDSKRVSPCERDLSGTSAVLQAVARPTRNDDTRGLFNGTRDSTAAAQHAVGALRRHARQALRTAQSCPTPPRRAPDPAGAQPIGNAPLAFGLGSRWPNPTTPAAQHHTTDPAPSGDGPASVNQGEGNVEAGRRQDRAPPDFVQAGKFGPAARPAETRLPPCPRPAPRLTGGCGSAPRRWRARQSALAAGTRLRRQAPRRRRCLHCRPRSHPRSRPRWRGLRQPFAGQAPILLAWPGKRIAQQPVVVASPPDLSARTPAPVARRHRRPACPRSSPGVGVQCQPTRQPQRLLASATERGFSVAVATTGRRAGRYLPRAVLSIEGFGHAHRAVGLPAGTRPLLGSRADRPGVGLTRPEVSPRHRSVRNRPPIDHWPTNTEARHIHDVGGLLKCLSAEKIFGCGGKI